MEILTRDGVAFRPVVVPCCTTKQTSKIPGLKWDIGYFTDAIGTTDVVRLNVSAVPIPPFGVAFRIGIIGPSCRGAAQSSLSQKLVG